MKEYHAVFHLAPDGITVTFPDLPEAITCGSTIDEARRMAAEVLRLTLDGRKAEGQNIPEPLTVLVELVAPKQ